MTARGAAVAAALRRHVRRHGLGAALGSLLFVQWDWMAVTTLLGLGDATHHTCTGDSGGPALMNVNRVPTITGVASFSTTGDFTLCTDG